MAFEIGGTGAGHLADHGQPSHDHATVGRFADPDDAVDALAHEVDQPVALADLQIDPGIAGQKLRQARQQEGAGEQRAGVDAQQAEGLGLAEGGLGILDLGQDRQAALIIGFAILRGVHLPRRPLQQAGAEMLFEPADGLRRG